MKEKFRVRVGITTRASTSMVKLNLGTRTILVRLSQTSQKDQTLTGNLGLDSPLNHLPYAVDAPFDSYHRQYEPTCLENTRVDVLQRIFDWVDGQDERCIFWLNGNYYRSSYVLVVDALNECDDENNIQTILDILAEVRSLETVQLRILMTSRREVPIRHGFCDIPEAKHKDFVLQNISPAIIDHDISIFLEYNLKLIRQERALDARWPGEEVIKRLVQSASGLFIWAATACQFIRKGKRFATKRLAMILEGSSTLVIGPEKHLNEIYITILSHSVSTNYTDEEREELCSMLRHILGCIVILFSPLSADSLSTLLHATKEDVDQTLDDLYAILDIPEDRTRPIRLHHPSFRDFLLDKTRCNNPKF
jgi:hypothetical protein